MQNTFSGGYKKAFLDMYKILEGEYSFFGIKKANQADIIRAFLSSVLKNPKFLQKLEKYGDDTFLNTEIMNKVPPFMYTNIEEIKGKKKIKFIVKDTPPMCER